MSIVFFEEFLITWENAHDIILSEYAKLKHNLIMYVQQTQQMTGGNRPGE